MNVADRDEGYILLCRLLSEREDLHTMVLYRGWAGVFYRCCVAKEEEDFRQEATVVRVSQETKVYH